VVKILFIHEVNYQAKVIYEMHEFPELLAARGHDVAFFHYPEGSGRFSRRANRERIQGRVHPEVAITLITPPTFGGRAGERVLAPLLAIRSLRREIRKGGYDVIVLYAVPTTGWQTVSIARRAGVPVVFRALDVSHLIRKSLLSPLIRCAERYVYRNATLLSANNPALGDYCDEISGRLGPTVVHVPPLDLSHFRGPFGNDLRGPLGLTQRHRVLVFMGSFFPFSGLDVVVDALPPLVKRFPDLRLVLVGGGELDADLRARVIRLDLANHVIFTGVVPYAELPKYLGLADVAINPFRRELLTNVALPHKVLQYMAAGKPVVSTSLTGLRAVLGDDSGVMWVEESGDLAVVAAELAYAPRTRLREIARRQMDFVGGHFEQGRAVDAFENSLKALGYHDDRD
jgi:glycosyltransferase involved in cell wall biosynthesis